MLKSLKKAIAVLGLTLFSSSAMAVDLTVSAPDESFDWNRFYANIYGGGHVFLGFPHGVAGVNLGANFQVNDMFVLGVEADGRYLVVSPSFIEVFGATRAGVLLTDDLLVYARGGLGLFDFSVPIFTAGGGVELAITDNVTLRGQVEAIGAIGTGVDTVAGTVGAAVYF